MFAHGGLRTHLLEHMLHLCPCTHTCQQEFCQQIHQCTDQAAWTHHRDLQLIHIKQQERGVKSHRSFNNSLMFNLTVEKYCLSNCWTVLWIYSKLRPNMVFSSLMCFGRKYCVSQIFTVFFFMNLLHYLLGISSHWHAEFKSETEVGQFYFLITKLYSRLSYCREIGKILKIQSILKWK